MKSHYIYQQSMAVLLSDPDKLIHHALPQGQPEQCALPHGQDVLLHGQPDQRSLQSIQSVLPHGQPGQGVLPHWQPEQRKTFSAMCSKYSAA